MTTTQAKLYNILTNPDGEMCIVLRLLVSYESKVEDDTAEIIYDGKEHAFLYRDDKESIIIDYIPKSEREKILSHKKILIVEYGIGSDDIQHEYFAVITKVSKIPSLNKSFLSREELKKELKELKELKPE